MSDKNEDNPPGSDSGGDSDKNCNSKDDAQSQSTDDIVSGMSALQIQPAQDPDVLLKEALAAQNERRELHKLLLKASRETQSKFEVYAKASCRQICDKVMERFPAELRERIYGFLLPVRSVNFKIYNMYPSFQASPKAEFREEFVGENFAREFAAHCYRKMNFVIPPTSIEEFNEFCGKDPDNGLLYPPYWLQNTDKHELCRMDYVRQLDFTLDIGLTNSERLAMDPDGSPSYGPLYEGDLPEAFPSSWLINQSAKTIACMELGVTIRIRASRDQWKLETKSLMIDAIDSVKPGLRCLIAAGHTVKFFEHVYIPHQRSRDYQEGRRWRVRNLTMDDLKMPMDHGSTYAFHLAQPLEGADKEYVKQVDKYYGEKWGDMLSEVRKMFQTCAE